MNLINNIFPCFFFLIMNLIYDNFYFPCFFTKFMNLIYEIYESAYLFTIFLTLFMKFLYLIFKFDKHHTYIFLYLTPFKIKLFTKQKNIYYAYILRNFPLFFWNNKFSICYLNDEQQYLILSHVFSTLFLYVLAAHDTFFKAPG